MNKEPLKAYLTQMLNIIDDTDKFMDDTYKICKIDFIEFPLFNNYSNSLDLNIKLISSMFAKSKEEYDELYDIINWFFFEYRLKLKDNNLEMIKENAQCWDKDKNPICYDIESLGDYIFSYKEN